MPENRDANIASINTDADSEFRSEISKVLQDICATAEATAKKLRSKAEDAARVQRIWEDMLQYVEKGWVLHIVSLMDREATVMEALRAENPSLAPVLDALYQRSSECATHVIHHFPALLDKACQEAGLPLDRDSRHPRYTFEDHFLLLEIDDTKGIARLSDREGLLAQMPADIGAIVQFVAREHKRLFGRAFDGTKLLRSLRRQYLAVVKKQGLPDGASIPIRKITRRLGKNVKRFRTDEFLVDLSQLVQKGPLETDGYRLDLQHTKDTNQGMLLHGAEGQGYIGFVTFRRM